MILTVTPENRSMHLSRIDQYLRIRKQVFHDLLGWDVVVHGEQEYDVYDHMPCYYILSLSDDGTVLGGLRQMPTNRPTLTWERFGDVVSDPTVLFANGVWETTRFVLRPKQNPDRSRSGVNRLALELCREALQFGLSRGARRHIAVCERRLVNLTRIFGVGCETIGQKTMRNGEEIVCAAWEVSDESVRRLARAENCPRAA